ncbi:MAG: hypothetical protein IJ901_01965 [Bacteroidaceae bacterium]|nr:hypothetical protein [Bacteroidaceae bacterium]
MLPPWENCATRLALQCHPGGITVRRKQENCATKVGKLCQGGEPVTDLSQACHST